MGTYPPSLEKLITQFARLPGIGPKSATRIALHILKSDGELARSLARGLMDVKDNIRFCSICCNLTDDDPCSICIDPSRANGLLCVVEGPGDQMAIEESGTFKGRYHILHGTLSPLDGIGPEDLKIHDLIIRLEKEKIEEIILATNPTAEGEATSSFLANLLADKGPRVSRIALGVPMGGNLRYMDALTLRHALQSRNPVRS